MSACSVLSSARTVPYAAATVHRIHARVAEVTLSAAGRLSVWSVAGERARDALALAADGNASGLVPMADNGILFDLLEDCGRLVLVG